MVATEIETSDITLRVRTEGDPCDTLSVFSPFTLHVAFHLCLFPTCSYSPLISPCILSVFPVVSLSDLFFSTFIFSVRSALPHFSPWISHCNYCPSGLFELLDLVAIYFFSFHSTAFLCACFWLIKLSPCISPYLLSCHWLHFGLFSWNNYITFRTRGRVQLNCVGFRASPGIPCFQKGKLRNVVLPGGAAHGISHTAAGCVQTWLKYGLTFTGKTESGTKSCGKMPTLTDATPLSDS